MSESTPKPRQRKPRDSYNLSAHWQYNDYRIEGAVAYLILRDRQGQPTGEAIIDTADLARVRDETSWSLFRPRPTLHYVSGVQRKLTGPLGTRKPNIYLHRFILDAPLGTIVDHRNGNGLDCRRANLRLAPGSINHLNKREHRRVREVETVLQQLLDCPHRGEVCACKRAARLVLDRAA